MAAGGPTQRQLSRSARPPSDPNEDARADEPCNQITQPAITKFDAEKAKQPTSDGRTDDAQNYVHEHADVPVHESPGQAASYASDDHGRDPPNLNFVHISYRVKRLAKISVGPIAAEDAAAPALSKAGRSLLNQLRCLPRGG